ncbi:MAG TPA: MFS transporter [Planctomycetaceae bacterium]|nr:MFS transporter [Planctomycetaceae bacterium]HIQ20352.1 MFS transporter [Planctomycetota bacterium]
MNDQPQVTQRWYAGLTGYHWLVLVIASLGWVFDIFEGQIFVASMEEMAGDLLEELSEGARERHNTTAFSFYLIGGALGGVFFGALSDRIGRTRTMILTILMYSLFTCLTAFAQAWWQVLVLRFLVALGTGGEWAVASAMVAEVFPQRARAWSLGIFHASSVLGTWLASLAGAVVVANPALGWRGAFLIGVLPALLTLWIRWRLREPDRWVKARQLAAEDHTQRTGRLQDLFAPGLAKNTLIGISLATIGLATFWGVHVFGKNLLRQWADGHYPVAAAAGDPGGVSAGQPDQAWRQAAVKRWEMLGMFLVTTGGGLGLVSFGPICERIGRRGAFLFFHLGGLASALIVFQLLGGQSPYVLCPALFVFGFLTLGMHAGYAIYFPELFPTRLRGTGAGLCFNGGRLLAASVIWVRGWMRDEELMGLTLEDTVSILSLLFLVGAALLLVAPETKGRDLPT